MSEAVIRKTISQEDMNRFAGLRGARLGTARPAGKGSHHTDPAVAKEAGLSGTVAQALHYCAYVSQLLLDEHGRRWVEGGELEIKFVRPLYAGDSVEVTLTESGADHARVECRNQDGQMLAFGNATLARDE
ncbi:MAG: MaoC family dehydratase [Dehalococcoidia bacterium]